MMTIYLPMIPVLVNDMHKQVSEKEAGNVAFIESSRKRIICSAESECHAVAMDECHEMSLNKDRK